MWFAYRMAGSRRDLDNRRSICHSKQRLLCQLDHITQQSGGAMPEVYWLCLQLPAQATCVAPQHLAVTGQLQRGACVLPSSLQHSAFV
jgi:hypothetical protein